MLQVLALYGLLHKGLLLFSAYGLRALLRYGFDSKKTLRLLRL